MPKILLPCVGGLQTRVAELLVEPPEVLRLENADLNVRGAYRLRKGTETLGDELLGFDPDEDVPLVMDDNDSLFYRGDELCLVSNNRLYSYAECPGGWIDKGPLTTAQLRLQQVFSQTGDPIRCDLAVLDDGLLVGIWQTSAGVYYAVGTTDGGVIVQPTLVDAGGSLPRATSSTTGEVAILVYLDPSTPSWKAAAISCAAPNTAPTWRDVSPAFVDTPTSDILGTEAGALLLCRSGVNTMRATGISDEGLVQSVSAALLDPALVALASEDDRVYVDEGTPTLHLQGSSLIGLGYTPVQLTAVTVGSTIYAALERSAASEINHQVQVFKRESSLSGWVLLRTRRSVGLSGAAFTVGGAGYLPLVHDSAQGCYLVEDVATGEVVARYGELGQITGVETEPCLARPEVSGSKAYLATTFKTVFLEDRDDRETGKIFNGRELQLATLDFTARPLPVAQLGDSAYLPAAGFVRVYDGGARVAEIDYHTIPVITATSVAGTGPAAGTYTLAAVYRDVDEQGRVVWSGIGTTEIVHTGNTIRVVVSTLRISARTSPRRELQIDVYISEDGAPERLYRATSAASPLLNDTSVDTVTFDIDGAISTYNDNEPLYTIGVPPQILSNDPTPATDWVAAAGRRLWTRDPRRGYVIRCSKELRLDYAVEMSPVTGVDLESTDSGVILVEQDGVYYCLGNKTLSVWQGDGPDAQGNGSYSLPETVPSEVGGSSQATVAAIRDGWVFQSQRGPRLLTRDRSMAPIADPVERLYLDEGQTVTGAVYRPSTGDLILGDDGDEADTERRTLRYHVGTQRWCTDTRWSARSIAAAANGDIAYIREHDGRVVRTADLYTDQGSAIQLAFETPWLKINGVGGYGQFLGLDLVGRYRSAHTLRIGIAWDQMPVFVDWVTFDSSTLPVPQTWGGGPDWGEDVAWGGIPDTSGSIGITAVADRRVYWWRYGELGRMASTIRFRVEMTPSDGGAGADIVQLEALWEPVDQLAMLPSTRLDQAS